MNNPFDFFDKIFYINLDSRTDRREFMEEQFKKYGINAERFPAVSLTKEQNDDLVKRGCNFYDDSRPEYAPRIKSCTISHLMILLKAKMMQYENYLILEDDVLFDENIINNLINSINELKTKNWDMYYLGCNPLEYYKESENLGRVIRTTTTHAYSINKKFYNKILDNVDFFKSYPCIDGYVGGLGRNKENKIYMSLNNLATQKGDFSNIEGSYVDYTHSIRDKYIYNIVEKPEGW
jgi:GR25 family glycosyltransferase involved in LPS biosynthesis